MFNGEYMMTMLKVLTVLIIVYSSFREARTEAERFFPALVVLAGAVAIHCVSYGISGIIHVVTGMSIGALCSIAQYRADRIDARELFTSIAIGALAGPAGAFFIFMIVYLLSLVERVFHAGTTCIMERYAAYLVETGIVEGPKALVSEARPSGAGSAATALRFINQTFPWNAKIALATLVIVFSGLMF